MSDFMLTMIPRNVDFCKIFQHESLIDHFHANDYRSGMDTKEESGRRIRAARNALGLTLKEVCDQTNGLLTPTRLSNWEHGHRMISVEEAKRLAPILDTTAGYLLTIDDTPGDKRIRTLIATYQKLDERGRDTVHRVAEAQLPYELSPKADTNKAA